MFIDWVPCCYIPPSLLSFCVALGEKRRELCVECFPSSMWVFVRWRR